MKINITSDTTSSHSEIKIIHTWLVEMCEEYKMNKQATHSAMQYFFSKKGSSDFINWVKKTKNVKIKFWEFGDDELCIARGFDLEENPDLTKALLQQ